MKRKMYCDLNSLSSYIKLIEKHNKLSLSERKNIDEIIINEKNPEKIKKAKKKLIEGNLFLVVKIAKDTKIKNQELNEIISRGNLGLIKAAETYKPGKSTFSTWATRIVKQELYRSINNSYVIKIPENYYKVVNSVEEKVQINPFDTEIPVMEDILSSTDIDPNTARTYTHIKNVLNIERETIHQQEKNLEILSQEYIPSPEVSTELTLFKENLDQILDILNDKEKFIIIQRYGIKQKQSRTYKSIAIKLNSSLERIRQIEAIALEKLKNYIL